MCIIVHCASRVAGPQHPYLFHLRDMDAYSENDPDPGVETELKF
jgi:hypothetical protein